MSFADYVRGKTIAIVGPAPAPYDQAAEVDAHDIVIRVGYDHWPWYGYGDRVDVVVLDWHHSQLYVDGKFHIPIPDDAWRVLKFVEDPGLPRTHTAYWPHRWGPFQATLALSDLTRYEPTAVTVYGCDFYISPGNAYQPTDYEHAATFTRDYVKSRGFVKGHINHQPKLDMALIRSIRALRGWPNGDDRFDSVLALSDDEYDRITSGWLQVIR